MSPQRKKELFERLRAQLLDRLENGGEAVFKEVWEECDGTEEVAFIDECVKMLAFALQGLNPFPEKG